MQSARKNKIAIFDLIEVKKMLVTRYVMLVFVILIWRVIEDLSVLFWKLSNVGSGGSKICKIVAIFELEKLRDSFFLVGSQNTQDRDLDWMSGL